MKKSEHEGFAFREFDLPSKLFRWCLANISTGNETFSYKDCFPQYFAAVDIDGYLWRSYDRRLQALVGLIDEGRPLRVLEVGCGFGHDLLWTALAGAQVVGIDVNSDFVDITRRTKKQIESYVGHAIDADIRRTNLMEMSGEAFDLIYMKDVFHHLEPRDEIVARLVDLLAPGGHILIVEPNAWNPLIQLQMFQIRGFNTIIEKMDAATGEPFMFGNERLVTGASLQRLFSHAGVRGESRLIRFLPTKLSGHLWMVRVADGLERMGLERLLRPACIHSIYFGCREFDSGGGRPRLQEAY